MQAATLVFFHYLIEILPVLLIGFLISGIIYEFVPTTWVEKHLGGKGIKPIFLATIVGVLLPVCCFGSLPLAISFYRKGARLGPVSAFLAATPATSISALLVTYRLLGPGFAIYIFFAVILLGIILGTLANTLPSPHPPPVAVVAICPDCLPHSPCEEHKKTLFHHLLSILKFSFIELPKDIGKEILIGIFLAALVATVVPIGVFIKTYLATFGGYIFALIFGLIMYICSTSSVPLVHALILKGMNIGAGMALLILGPITAFGALLVIRKEFGIRILLFYLFLISLLSLTFGYIFQLLPIK